MSRIKLDARTWRTPLDFYAALKRALNAPEWCGFNVNAINELTVWRPEAGELPPHHVVYISGIHEAPTDVQDEVAVVADCVRQACREYIVRDCKDVEVSISY